MTYTLYRPTSQDEMKLVIVKLSGLKKIITEEKRKLH